MTQPTVNSGTQIIWYHILNLIFDISNLLMTFGDNTVNCRLWVSNLISYIISDISYSIIENRKREKNHLLQIKFWKARFSIIYFHPNSYWFMYFLTVPDILLDIIGIHFFLNFKPEVHFLFLFLNFIHYFN